MAAPKLVAVGASAGGVDAIRALVAGLPGDFPAALLIVLHIPVNAETVLPQILSRASSLPAKLAANGERLRRGRIYVAPPDRHLGVRDGHARVWFGPKENGHRPSIDATFRSVAAAGKNAAGVVLSGLLSDGAEGLRAIQGKGGLAVVQDPAQAAMPDMPRNALKLVKADIVLPVERIPRALRLWSRGAMKPERSRTRVLGSTGEVREKIFSCPECDGVLTETKTTNGEPVFTCLVGHRFSWESLTEDQTEAMERALWTAIRALSERAQIASRLMQEAKRRRNRGIAAHFERRKKQFTREATAIRAIVKHTHRR
jgi:two-component system, chemotaxis family, protein-glutamate methylesterase/glutaminase